jgi:ADP-ribose pyrophosphatase YjhB (NUDIX family)
VTSSSDAGAPPFAVVPASYVYLLREGPQGTEVLLQQRGDVPYMGGHWAAGAAGHVERGEDATAAAARELREELDVEALDLRFEFTMQRTQYAGPIEERVDFFFSARTWSGTPRVVEPEKCAGLGWFALDELPSPIVPHEAHALDGGAQGTLAAAHQRFFEDVFLDLAHKLDAVDEGSGPTLLDNSLMMWSQESGLYTHESVSQPVITFGSAAGFLKTGQYADYRNLQDDGMAGWGGGNQMLYPGLCYNQWLGTALRACNVEQTEYESGEYGGYGEVFIGEGRSQFYPSAVFEAAGDILPWLESDA